MKKNITEKGFTFIAKQEGFTFIELILYIAIVSGLLTTLIPFAWSVIEGGAKSATQQEVYTQARYMSERIKKEIRDSSAVTSCSATEIGLTNPVAANSIRFCYDSSLDFVSFNQGNPPAACPAPASNRVHSNNTLVTVFNCTNFTGANTDNVQFSFTMTDNSTSTRNEYIETINIQSSAETRN